jgi:hypothetical protein
MNCEPRSLQRTDKSLGHQLLVRRIVLIQAVSLLACAVIVVGTSWSLIRDRPDEHGHWVFGSLVMASLVWFVSELLGYFEHDRDSREVRRGNRWLVFIAGLFLLVSVAIFFQVAFPGL